MTKWYGRIGNTIEMFVFGKWIKGIIVNGARTGDGVINMEDLTGKKYWCGSSGEGVHFRKCDDSDGDLISNADRIRQMTDEELAEFLFEVEYRRSAYGDGAKWQSKEDALKYLQEEVEG